MAESPSLKRDAVVLAIALVVPSVMTWCEFMALPADGAPDKPMWQWLFLLAKAAQFVFPLAFMLMVDRGSFGWSRPRGVDVMLGGAIGIVVGLGALGLYYLFLHGTPLLAQTGELVAHWLKDYGLATPGGFWTVAVFMAAVHAFLEEYYWRWFVFRLLCRHVSTPWAIAVSALGFMAHHVVILTHYLPGFFWLGVVPFSLCVAVGGVIWAWLYQRSQSLLPNWLSHGLVDLALMTVGWDLVSSVL